MGSGTVSTADFLVTRETKDLLAELDAFVQAKIAPLQAKDDNDRFFDHRREDSRTDWHRNGLPNQIWIDLLKEMRRLADEAGYYRLCMPAIVGGKGASLLTMSIIREHLNSKGLGLASDLQNETAIVGNIALPLVVANLGSADQRTNFLPKLLSGAAQLAFALTEPDHGSDATHMETRAVRDGDAWVINGVKTWNTGVDTATHDLVIARSSGEAGDGSGLTAFIVPMDAPGVKIEQYLWTFNMPTDHARVSFTNVRVPHSAILGPEGNGLSTASMFLNENRIRQAASSLGAAVYCITESVKYANARKVFGKPVSVNQAIQWPLIELHTEAEMLRMLIRDTAAKMDTMTRDEASVNLGHRVSMCNYRANRLACQAADTAIQTHGAMGYSRHLPFEHIYRHHRRYRITEGSEQIQMRNVGKELFGFGGRKAIKAAAKL